MLGYWDSITHWLWGVQGRAKNIEVREPDLQDRKGGICPRGGGGIKPYLL